MRACFTFRTQIVFTYFSKMSLQQKDLFLRNHPKKTLFSGLFWNCPFPCFSLFLFCSIRHEKRQKLKMHSFFENPFFDTPTTCPKKYFAPLHTICDFKLPPQNTKKLGGGGVNKPKKSWVDFWLNLGQRFDSKRPNLGQIFDFTIYIYVL